MREGNVYIHSRITDVGTVPRDLDGSLVSHDDENDERGPNSNLEGLEVLHDTGKWVVSGFSL